MGKTVQESIEAALSIFCGHKVHVVGASRTDSGVHAEGQVIIFRTHKQFSLSSGLIGFNALLPKSICFRSLDKVNDSFHPIVNSKAKIYRYRLWVGRCSNPFIRDLVWNIPREANVDVIKKAAKYMIGSHDFTSFCAKDSDIRSKHRTIFDLSVEQKGQLINLWFLGDGFLKQMIRIIVGTFVDISLDKISYQDIPMIFSKEDRSQAGQTAPPHGLSLVKIFYDKVGTIDDTIKDSEEGFCISL